MFLATMVEDGLWPVAVVVVMAINLEIVRGTRTRYEAKRSRIGTGRAMGSKFAPST
jgi:hypothetical protein